MLPSNPRAGRSRSVARQPEPTTSATRSRSATRPRERERERYHEHDNRSGTGRAAQDGGYARPVRPQRSMSNIRPSRTAESFLPPPPPLPSSSRSDYGSRSTRTVPSSYSKPPASRDSDSSSLSMSSSGSSFLDRMKHRPAASNSSRSSFEVDSDASKETGGAGDARNPYLIRDEQVSSYSTNDLASYGYSIWNRVASAASAWAGNGSSKIQISGVAPSSGDSEITRALKTYHISKARDRSDLPDWLFSERERGLDSEKPTRQSGRSYERESDGDNSEPVSRARGRGFRDIYDSVAASDAELRSRESGRGYSRSEFGSDTTTPIRPASKATDRLKAIRDAKRLAARVEHAMEPVVRKAMSDVGSRDIDAYDRRYEDSLSSRRAGRDAWREPEKRIPPPRVGLPTNPRRR